ncbi:MAG: hypothetical protein QM526_00985 [Alphaproteobacteria bacterium]|nr:hypothetical protein [Alphaproteobacteria bacterium]
MIPQIVPAILESTFPEIVQRITEMQGQYNYVQVDVIDGKYAPSITWPYNKLAEIHRAREHTQTLPVDFEVDLMVRDPERTLSAWLSTRAKRIIIHYRSTLNLARCIDDVKRAKKEVSIALTAGDTFDKDLSLLASVDAIQCMGIERVGFQRQPFHEDSIALIKKIKKTLPRVHICVDGAVSPKTIGVLYQAGARQFAVGSALFRGDLLENKKELEQALIDIKK